MGTPPTRAALALLAAALLLPGVGAAQRNDAKALAEVRGRIKDLEDRIEEQSLERDETSRALKKQELEIAAAERRLAELRGRSQDQQGRVAAANERAAAAEAQLEAERGALARQVRLAYMNGREELFKLLLSQESPAAAGRMVVYYGYFNRARAQRIRSVGAEVDALKRLRAQRRQQEAELARLEQSQSAELEKLGRSRDERASLLAKLDSSLSSAGDEVAKLKDREAHLTRVLARLGDAMARFPRDSEAPFPSAKGHLAWPVQGKLTGDFGDEIAGGAVRRKGVLFSSPAGTTVRAIYHGRVAFADWLPGLGLLIVIDHGDGYMSLYGHNSALLKEAGDWVTPGEPIAEVGDTGGQTKPSLYFEIRHEGRAVDPHDWMRR